MIIFFSATGNSKAVAERLGVLLNDEVVDSFPYVRQLRPLASRLAFSDDEERGSSEKAGSDIEFKAEFRSQKPWVFVVPTYAWRVPRFFDTFIERSVLSGAKEAYFVLTCGSSMGGSAAYAKKFCEKKGLAYMGTAQVVMPENYIAMFRVPDKAEWDRIAAKGVSGLEPIAEKIAAGEALGRKGAGPLAWLLSGLMNSFFFRFIVKDKNFNTDDGCNGCGLCERLCPLGNISYDEAGRPVWHGNCTHCMACVMRCPKRAVHTKR